MVDVVHNSNIYLQSEDKVLNYDDNNNDNKAKSNRCLNSR
jgi:hypothetical protein